MVLPLKILLKYFGVIILLTSICCVNIEKKEYTISEKSLPKDSLKTVLITKNIKVKIEIFNLV